MRRLWPNSPGVLVVAALSAFLDGCLFQHSPMVFNPPPPRAQPRTPATAPPQLPEPPEIALDASATIPPDIPTSIPELAAPPQPKPQQKKTYATTPPKPQAPASSEQTAPPRLGQVFTPEQEREYNRNIDENLDRVKKALTILSRKSLNPDQTEAANRITNFQKQAEQFRDAHDLASADLWARRAATLADDLLTRVP